MQCSPIEIHLEIEKTLHILLEIERVTVTDYVKAQYSIYSCQQKI